jgi:hypothetical protein
LAITISDIQKIQASDASLILKEGVSAPFSGVLVPEYQYRKMSADILEKDLLRNQILVGQPEETFDTTTFLGGVVIGLVGTLAIQYVGRK